MARFDSFAKHLMAVTEQCRQGKISLDSDSEVDVSSAAIAAMEKSMDPKKAADFNALLQKGKQIKPPKNAKGGYKILVGQNTILGMCVQSIIYQVLSDRTKSKMLTRAVDAELGIRAGGCEVRAGNVHSDLPGRSDGDAGVEGLYDGRR